MPRTLPIPTLIAAALAGLATLPAPGHATPIQATPLGNPAMQVLTAKIPLPYSPDFNLSTAFSRWPPLADVTFLRETSKDSTGMIEVNRSFSNSTLFDHGKARALDSGTFLSAADMWDPFSTLADHVGVFSFTQWSQSFRKDSANATYRFTISGAWLYVRCLTGKARAEFATDVRAWSGGVHFYAFHQDAGVKLTGQPPQVPIVDRVAHGPMLFTETNPDGIQRDRLIEFVPRTFDIDLSSIPVGGEFTVLFDEMTQANMTFDDVVRAIAHFRDPVDDSLGVIMELSGLTPTDQPELPPLAVAPGPPAAVASLSAPRPNPAPGRVTLTLDLTEAGEVNVGVFDLAGRHVAELARGSFSAGRHAITWDPASGAAAAPPGLYFVRATGPGLDAVRRVARVAGQ
jgi:hypothetical protein